MIEAVVKALDIMEFLAEEPERSHALSEIAGHLKLNQATCSHTLKTLVERAYVEQMGAKKGYRLGPMIYSMTRRGPYRKDLVSAAEPLMRQLAREIHETVLLAILSRTRRFTLCQIDGTHDVQVRSDVAMAGNAYDTATGRLLLANLKEKELADFIRANGLPGSRWPGARTKRALRKELVRIRDERSVMNVTDRQVVGLGEPICEGDRVVAALGLFLPEYRFVGKHKDKLLKGMRKTAQEINKVISSHVAGKR